MTAPGVAVAAYLDHLTVEVGASPHTVASYRRDLRRYTTFLSDIGITSVTDIKPDHVSQFTQSLSQPHNGQRGLAASSVARAVIAVRSFHRFAVTDGITDTNPTVDIKPPKQPQRLPKALSISQIQALLEAPDTTTVIGLRDAAVLELLYGTGSRISEMCALDVDDITAALADADAGLRLFGKGRKERIVPVGSFARAAVEAYLVRGRPALIAKAKKPSPALFLNQRGNRLSRQSAWGIVQGAANKAAIVDEVSPHTLRHSFATHLLDGGADVRVVQELLGHASVTTTQLYTKVTVDHLREVFIEAHPRARQQP